MLLHKIEKTHFSESEHIIIDYILKHGEEIEKMTISQLADITYTSAPLFIRLAKKLGYNGWNEFKDAFLKELKYIYANQEIDASIPFTVDDNMMSIVHHIIQLEKETLDDTLSLLKHDDLQLALRLMRKSQVIDIYGLSSGIHIAEIFQYNMMCIGKNVNICQTTNMMQIQSSVNTQTHCAILISYSGQTKSIINIAKKLKIKQIPIIALTNIADNTLSQLADVTLRLSSREMINVKIADFSTTQSIKCLLDILYSCIFSLDYQNNLDYRIQLGKEIDESQFE